MEELLQVAWLSEAFVNRKYSGMAWLFPNQFAKGDWCENSDTKSMIYYINWTHEIHLFELLIEINVYDRPVASMRRAEALA